MTLTFFLVKSFLASGIVDLEEAERKRRRQALAALLSLDAPVTDWEQMEEEIISGALE